jgi:hypothetical protein
MIHYHGTPMSTTLDMIKAFAGKHAMVSYEHPEQLEIAAEVCQSIVLDNGAFSAWQQGKTYDFDGYADWASRWIRHPAVDWCVIPDRIDGTESDNKALVQAWKLTPASSVPVWHFHESLEYLEWLMQWPRLALGSSGQFAEIGTDHWWKRLVEAMRVLCDAEGRPKVKLHGLRMLDPGVFSKVPLASADSCNVARNVGLDTRWKGSYAPKSRYARAVVLMERIEHHASAAHWSEDAIAAYQNFQLFG